MKTLKINNLSFGIESEKISNGFVESIIKCKGEQAKFIWDTTGSFDCGRVLVINNPTLQEQFRGIDKPLTSYYRERLNIKPKKTNAVKQNKRVSNTNMSNSYIVKYSEKESVKVNYFDEALIAAMNRDAIIMVDIDNEVAYKEPRNFTLEFSISSELYGDFILSDICRIEKIVLNNKCHFKVNGVSVVDTKEPIIEPIEEVDVVEAIEETKDVVVENNVEVIEETEDIVVEETTIEADDSISITDAIQDSDVAVAEIVEDKTSKNNKGRRERNLENKNIMGFEGFMK